MEASSAGGEIWDAVRRSLKRPLLCSQIWDDRLADTQTHRHTRKKKVPQAKPIGSRARYFHAGGLSQRLPSRCSNGGGEELTNRALLTLTLPLLPPLPPLAVAVIRR